MDSLYLLEPFLVSALICLLCGLSLSAFDYANVGIFKRISVTFLEKIFILSMIVVELLWIYFLGTLCINCIAPLVLKLM